MAIGVDSVSLLVHGFVGLVPVGRVLSVLFCEVVLAHGVTIFRWSSACYSDLPLLSTLGFHFFCLALGPFWAVLVDFCCFLAWLLFNSATDAFSLSPTVTYIRSRLCFRFRPASMPVFCCWVLSSYRFVFVLLPVFIKTRFGGIVLSLSLVCGYSMWLVLLNVMAMLLLSLETSSFAVFLLFSLVVMQWWW